MPNQEEKKDKNIAINSAIKIIHNPIKRGEAERVKDILKAIIIDKNKFKIIYNGRNLTYFLGVKSLCVTYTTI